MGHTSGTPGHRATTKFCTQARNIFGFSGYSLLHIMFLALRILRFLVSFWKTCASLWSRPLFIPLSSLLYFLLAYVLSFFLPVFLILFKIVNCYSIGDSNIPACYLITLTPKTLLILHGLIDRLVVHDDFATRND